jgi:hypothetical protein
LESRCYVIHGKGFSPHKAKGAEADKLIKTLKKKGVHAKKTILNQSCKAGKPTKY